MAFAVDAAAAREILSLALSDAERKFHANEPPDDPMGLSVQTERLFTSATQAFREALVGCVVARLVDERINVRHPATETSEDSFSGRSLADQVITPFLRQHAIPASQSPYLSALRGGARFVPGGAPRILRDAEGFDALVMIVDRIASDIRASVAAYLLFLLHRFVLLREASRIDLRRIAKPNLHQLERLIGGLLSVRSGGRLPALLATAMFQTISECHNLNWDVVFQGINVADAASGAVGDITVKKDDVIVLGAEVTERAIDRGRVMSTFEKKVAPNDVSDYLFITTATPDPDAVKAACNFTNVGHEMSFVQLHDWLVNNLASIGPTCRAIFQSKVLALLLAQSADLKVAWNEKMDLAIGL